MHNDINPNSPKSWLELSNIRSLRVDPTTKSGTQFEIDWITLSAPPTVATEYQVRWSAINTGFSTFDLNLVDSMGYRIEMASGLSTETRSYTVNLSKLVLDQYFAEVIATPGPTAVSAGPISLIVELPPNVLLFKNSFE